METGRENIRTPSMITQGTPILMPPAIVLTVPRPQRFQLEKYQNSCILTE